MQWEVVIGLETHVQLSTDSKIFPVPARISELRPTRRLATLIWRYRALCPF